MNRPPVCAARLARALALASLSTLTACGSISGLDGGSRYACQAPVGVACDSVSGVYANTLARTSGPTAGATASGPAATRGTATAPVGIAAPAPAPANAAFAPVSPIDTDRSQSLLPARTPPRILRLWIRPWEDSDGDLHDQAHVYVQIDSGRWRMDHVQQQLREASIPIRLPPASGAAGQAQSGAQPRPVTLPRPPAAPTPAPGARP